MALELAEKVNAAIENNMEIIFCFGEQLEDRKSGAHFEVVKTQLKEGLFMSIITTTFLLAVWAVVMTAAAITANVMLFSASIVAALAVAFVVAVVTHLQRD